MSRQRHTHTLTVVVKPAEGAWHAYCPVLLDYGAATWGATREDALGHIREMVAMLVERLAEKGAPIPTAADPAPVLPTEQVVVTVARTPGPRREGGRPGPPRFLPSPLARTRPTSGRRCPAPRPRARWRRSPSPRAWRAPSTCRAC